MQARLIARDKAKGDNDENKLLAAQEAIRCQQMGIEIGEVLSLEQMVNTDDVIFAATAITPTVLMGGISTDAYSRTSNTLLVNGRDRSLKIINNRYFN